MLTKSGRTIWTGDSAKTAVLAAAAILVYLPVVLHAGWIWDDYKFVDANPRLETVEGLKALWTDPGTQGGGEARIPEVEVHWFPLLYTTFWVERWILGGPEARAAHAVNVAVHALNVLLAWTLLRKLRVPGAYAGALLWAVHPGAMEAVGMVMGRKDLLAAFWMLLAVHVWVGGSQRGTGEERIQPGWGRTAAVCALALLGMLCKSTAIVLPGLLVTVVLWRGSQWGMAVATRAAAVLAAAAGVGAVQWWILTTLSDHATHDFSTLEHVLIGARAAWTHLYLGIVPGPSPLAMRTWEVDRGDPFGWMAVAAGIVAVAVAAWGWRRGHRGPGTTMLWFIAALSPVLGVLDHPSLHMSMVWGHHRYLASLAVCALLAGTWVVVQQHADSIGEVRSRTAARIGTRAAAATMLVFCTVATWSYGYTLKNDATWYRHQVEHNPDSDWLASYALAALMRAGHVERAWTQAKARWEEGRESLRRRRDLAVAAAETGRKKRAIRMFGEMVPALEAREAELERGRRCTSPRNLDGPFPLERAEIRTAWLNYAILLEDDAQVERARAMKARAEAVVPEEGEVWVFRGAGRNVLAGEPGVEQSCREEEG